MSYISRPAEIVRTNRQGWISEAVQAVLAGDDILVVDPNTGRRCFVAARPIPPNKPVWGVIWRALRDAGIRAPRWPK
jgi:hypothetical protein